MKYRRNELEEIEADLRIEKLKNEILKNMYIGY